MEQGHSRPRGRVGNVWNKRSNGAVPNLYRCVGLVSLTSQNIVDRPPGFSGVVFCPCENGRFLANKT